MGLDKPLVDLLLGGGYARISVGIGLCAQFFKRIAKLVNQRKKL